MTTAVAIPEPVRQRILTTFMITMTSEHVGEREAALAVFHKLLKAHGLTIYDVTSGALDALKPAAAQPPRPEPPPQPPAQRSSLRPSAAGWGDWQIDGDEMQRLLAKIRAHYRPAPGEFDDEFISSMEQRVYAYSTIILSHKQLDIVKRLLRRVPS